MTLFSQMSKKQLQQEIERLIEAEDTARRQGLLSQASIYRQQKNMARSYLVDPDSIEQGAEYEAEDETSPFIVSYINGVMAWGSWKSDKQLIALPISVLKKKNSPHHG